MVQIQDTLVSLDLFKECFCCDLAQCHGQCCVEGDAGAPVEEDEIACLEEAAELLDEELTDEARCIIRDEGVVTIDRDGEFVTSVVRGRDCVFAVQDTGGITLCAIDRAHREGRTTIQKPLSCALYPIRISDVGGLTALNYHRWEVCRSACQRGRQLQLPVYQFLKQPLIRAFGQAWWDECELVAGELKKAGYLDEP